MQLILDFSEYLEIIIIRRVTHNTNPKIFHKLGVDKELKEPRFYLITNKHSPDKKFEKFEDFLKTMDRNKVYNTGTSLFVSSLILFF